ncbi:MAG: hypothetical protein IIA87_03480 [Nanoarchaeota archaeon]|nr:hypothetical protein [Nanoarchaeota archaeon]
MSLGGFLNTIISGDMRFRDDVFNDEFKGIIIDTVLTSDTGKWETGIKRKNIEGEWIIVEMYENREEAKTKHEEWVKRLKKDPKMKLKDCITPEEWAFGEY